jgi:cytidylate kinase
MMENIPVITIDGPSSSGKGTISHLLADKLQWHFLDSGVVYRALALAVIKKQLSIDNLADIENLAYHLKLAYKVQPHSEMIIYLDGEDITAAIRENSCGEMASKLSVYQPLRTALLERQRAFRKPPGLVADGRDMGTVVFPDAFLKIFLVADVEIRAQRRYKQLQEMGINVSLGQVLDDLKLRDQRDQERTAAPLKPADDAIIIDSTALTKDQVLAQIENEAVKRIHGLFV